MATILLLLSLLSYFPDQNAKPNPPTGQDAERTPSECSQSETERDPLIREAERNRYMVRWVIFAGNEHTSDNLLRRRLINLNGGDVFTRENLAKSLESVSKLKRVIRPVQLSDVTVSLDRAEKLIDMEICFKEKRKTRR